MDNSGTCDRCGKHSLALIVSTWRGGVCPECDRYQRAHPEEFEPTRQAGFWGEIVNGTPEDLGLGSKEE